MTTIPRNHTAVIAALKTQYLYAVGHHKNDSYAAQAVDASIAWSALAGHRRAVLTRHDDRKITHPLGWFDLFPDEAAYTATVPTPPTGSTVMFPALQHRVLLGELRRTVPNPVAKALLRDADEALATAVNGEAHTALLAAMAELERAAHPREAAAIEAIADELATALTTSEVSR
ncbi:MAG: hypothetical protein ACJ786_28175 [Catenulispora sp.]